MIHEADGRCVQINQDLVAGWLRLFDLADAQIFRASEGMTEHCPHRFPSSAAELAACSFWMLRTRPNWGTAEQYHRLERAPMELTELTPSWRNAA